MTSNSVTPTVIVDLDDTCHDFCHTAGVVALNDFEIRLDRRPRRWQVWNENFENDVDLFKQFVHRCFARENIFLTKPFPHAPQALTEIKAAGYNIFYVSDRPIEAHDDTVDWLKTHNMPDAESLRCCEDKRSFLLALHLSENVDIRTVIDDRVRTLVYARTTLGLDHVFALRHNYNMDLRDAEGFHIFESWDEILTKFMDLEKTEWKPHTVHA